MVGRECGLATSNRCAPGSW